MIFSDKACFFSGHRILPQERREKILSLLEEKIIEKYNEGITDFICGGAIGFDTYAAQTVLRLKNMEQYKDMRLILYIPNYEYGENWTYQNRCILKTLKCNADIFEIVTKVKYSNESIKIRNQRMVDEACCGIVYKTTNRSGTGQTVAMASRQEKSVINIADYF